MNDFLVRDSNNIYYSIGDNNSIISSDNIVAINKFNPDLYKLFLNNIINLAIKGTSYESIAPLFSTKYMFKNKYLDSIISKINTSAEKFFIKDGVKIYSLNPLTLQKANNETLSIDDINKYGSSSISITSNEMKKLSNSAFLISYSETVSDKLIVNVKFSRSYICTLKNPAFLYYSDGDTKLDNNIEISGLQLTQYSYNAKINSSNELFVSKNVLDDDESTIVIPTENFKTSENPYTLSIKVTDSMLTETVKNSSIYLQNTEPNCRIELNKMVCNLFFDDPDKNRVRFKLLLNGNKYYPMVGEWTDYIETPSRYSSRFSTDEINVGTSNTIHAYFQDEFGKSGKLEYNFEGQNTGLLFADEDNTICSDDIGNILKVIDLGKVDAGKSSDIKKMKIINLCGHDNENVVLAIQNILPDSKFNAYISKSNNPFSESTVVTFDKIMNNEEKIFFIKVSTNPDIECGNAFNVSLIADPVRG